MSEGTPLLPAISPVPARQTRKNVQKWSLFAAVFITVLVGGWVLSGGPSLGPRPVHASVDNVLSHLEHLQRIASLPQHFGSRSVARGFNASADYVVGFLKNHTSLKVWREHLLVQEQVDFEAPTLALNNQSFAHNKHFLTATGSGSGVFNRAPLYFVGGCDADLDSFSYNALSL
ncbi:hypothetical protein BC830DRAFT_1174411 [Chytriomyces sp. MP71]|nr:hypothetical protein BC830DRAFT_1174411 [Chytriomyces sp. MP71]